MKITKEKFNKAKKTFIKKSLFDTQKNTMLSAIYTKTGDLNNQILSPLILYTTFFKRKAFVVITVLIILISGTSYASAKSLPGDLLYPIKTKIIEPIGLILHFNEKANDEYKIKLLERRLRELEELEKSGKLNEETKQQSSETTNHNVKDVESSSIFNEKGENNNVTSKVRSYNNLVDDETKIESDILIDVDIESELPLNIINAEVEEDQDSEDQKNEDESEDNESVIEILEKEEIKQKNDSSLNL